MLERVLRFSLRWRYATLAGLLATTMIVVGTIRGGIVPFVLLQNVDGSVRTVADPALTAIDPARARLQQAVEDAELPDLASAGG